VQWVIRGRTRDLLEFAAGYVKYCESTDEVIIACMRVKIEGVKGVWWVHEESNNFTLVSKICAFSWVI
jgi:hypothetical protein